MDCFIRHYLFYVHALWHLDFILFIWLGQWTCRDGWCGWTQSADMRAVKLNRFIKLTKRKGKKWWEYTYITLKGENRQSKHLRQSQDNELLRKLWQENENKGSAAHGWITDRWGRQVNWRAGGQKWIMAQEYTKRRITQGLIINMKIQKQLEKYLN